MCRIDPDRRETGLKYRVTDITIFLQEEDEEELKWELLAWALGDSWQSEAASFLSSKDSLWRRMGYRSAVSARQCDQIMAISGYSGLWNR